MQQRYAQWNGQTKLGRQAPHDVGQHRLLLDQQGPGRMQGQDALLLQTFDRYEPHARPGCGLTDPGRVGCVVPLAPFHDRPDRLGRDQLHLVSETSQHARPVMRRTARLHGDNAGLLLFKEWKQLAPEQLTSGHHLPSVIYCMDLEN